MNPGNSREFPGISIPGNCHFRSLAYYRISQHIIISRDGARGPTLHRVQAKLPYVGPYVPYVGSG